MFEGTEAVPPILQCSFSRWAAVKKENKEPKPEHKGKKRNNRTMQIVPEELITLEMLNKPKLVRFSNPKVREEMIAELEAKAKEAAQGKGAKQGSLIPEGGGK